MLKRWTFAKKNRFSWAGFWHGNRRNCSNNLVPTGLPLKSAHCRVISPLIDVNVVNNACTPFLKNNKKRITSRPSHAFIFLTYLFSILRILHLFLWCYIGIAPQECVKSTPIVNNSYINNTCTCTRVGPKVTSQISYIGDNHIIQMICVLYCLLSRTM